MTTPSVYLISGANRGIGLGLARELASRDNTIVFAGARKPADATELRELEKQFSGKVHLLELVSADEAGNAAAAAKVKEIAGRLDVVIANAGIRNSSKTALETPPGDLREHFEVNAVGPLVLFQATYPLLKASTPTPKFIAISSGAGSVELGPTIPMRQFPYGASKAALNWLARLLHFEHSELVCFALTPGPVLTDMAVAGLNEGGDFEAWMKKSGIPLESVEVASAGMLKLIDSSTRESMGGVFAKWNPEGGRFAW